MFGAAGLLVILLATFATALPVLGQDERLLGIVVIDTQRIYREAEAVRELQKRIDDQRSSYQNELRKKEEVLEQVAKLQGEVQSRRQDLEKEFALGMKQVQAAMVEISREIAEEHKSDLVIEKSAVVLVRPELEITQEALKRLNQRLPKVALPAPQD
jgi:Skp family chaperone for outer membrane proteins